MLAVILAKINASIICLPTVHFQHYWLFTTTFTFSISGLIECQLSFDNFDNLAPQIKSELNNPSHVSPALYT